MSSAIELSRSSAPARSQYHHFVPRFILKNFAHPYQSDEAPSSSKQSNNSGKKDRKRGKKKKGPRPGDMMLNVVNLKGDNACIEETQVATTLGMTDMYRDERAQNQNHLEEKLSKLESAAAMVMHKMRKAFENGDPDVWVTRSERDTLRKFLFIMKYRNSGFHKRYFYQNAEEYWEGDRQKLRDYMRKKGYEKPVDVWFENIRTIVELKMDPQMKWKDLLMESMYPDDAMWYLAHCQMMYLALCTPANVADEFLLTENLYSIYEGPVSLTPDPESKRVKQGTYTEFHNFAAIAPKLMIVLRSFLLPVPEEDADEELKHWRQNWFEQVAAQYGTSINVQSLFEDLPISKARNTYTRIVNGRVELLDSENGIPRLRDKFCFRFFPVSTKHIDQMNFVMLENAHYTSTIVFNTHEVLMDTIKKYLTTPCEPASGNCFKTIVGEDGEQRLSFLKKLEIMAGDPSKELVYSLGGKAGDSDDVLVAAGYWLKEKYMCNNTPTEFLQLYNILGGSLVTLPKDMDQAQKMLNMRIEIDVWSRGLDEFRRQEFRDQMARLFWQLPAQRVWLYLSRVRMLILNGKKIVAGPKEDASQLKLPDQRGYAEDVIAEASPLMRIDQVNRLMWVACMSEIYRPVLFGLAGSICDCGIKAVDNVARNCRESVQLTLPHEVFKLPSCTADQYIESNTRGLVRDKYEEIFGASAEEPTIKSLWKVLARIYP